MKKAEYATCLELLNGIEKMLPKFFEISVSEEGAKMIERFLPSGGLTVTFERPGHNTTKLRTNGFTEVGYNGHVFKVRLSDAGAYLLLLEMQSMAYGGYSTFKKLPDPPKRSIMERFIPDLKECEAGRK